MTQKRLADLKQLPLYADTMHSTRWVLAGLLTVLVAVGGYAAFTEAKRYQTRLEAVEIEASRLKAELTASVEAEKEIIDAYGQAISVALETADEMANLAIDDEPIQDIEGTLKRAKEGQH